MQGEMRRRRGESVDGRGDRTLLRRADEAKKEVTRASNGSSVASQVVPAATAVVAVYFKDYRLSDILPLIPY